MFSDSLAAAAQSHKLPVPTAAYLQTGLFESDNLAGALVSGLVNLAISSLPDLLELLIVVHADEFARA